MSKVIRDCTDVASLRCDSFEKLMSPKCNMILLFFSSMDVIWYLCFSRKGCSHVTVLIYFGFRCKHNILLSFFPHGIVNRDTFARCSCKQNAVTFAY